METVLTLFGVAILQTPKILQGSENLYSEKNRIFIFRRWISVLLMLPIFLTQPIKINLELNASEWLLLLLNAMLILEIILLFFKFTSRKPEQYVQVDLSGQPLQVHFVNAISWIAYLFFYEGLIRVRFVNELAGTGMNEILAIYMSLLVYVVLHLPQGLRITLASVPFGILASVWVFMTGSLIPAVVLHLVCALGYDYCITWNRKSGLPENIFGRLSGFQGKNYTASNNAK